MKRTKFFIGAAALSLAVVGFITTKAHSAKKFIVTKAVAKALGVTLFSGAGISHLTVTQGSPARPTAFFSTGTNSYSMYTSLTSNNKLYYF